VQHKEKQSMRITVLVSNDLEHDQRVAKVCGTLSDMGWQITLAGRILPDSKPFERPYEIRRFKLLFTKGALFYAALNIRLFFYLLTKSTDVILANDLDTLLPAYLVSKIRGKKLVYDSHEYFTEAEGLTGRPLPKRIWEKIEGWIFPKLKYVFCVNETVANIYSAKYGVPIRVVRNIPLLEYNPIHVSRAELGLPDDKKIVLLQGAYIDPDRGGAELVESIKYTQGVLLLIIGAGRDIENLKQQVKSQNQDANVRFLPRMPFAELRRYTAVCDLGISIDKPAHLNYTYSLPNKLFDYIHAGTPVLVSDLPELKRVVNKWKVGMVLEEVTPQKVARAIMDALQSSEYSIWKTNCISARKELNWQKESEIIRAVYSEIERDFNRMQ
jgi:glycosyltransferase involved in cell wall biosynthesis